MQKFIHIFTIITLCLTVFTKSFAEESQPNLACPDVIICGSGDTSKQTYNAYLNDQKAYVCYYNHGDTEMLKLASSAMTRCQTIQASINPNIRSDR